MDVAQFQQHIALLYGERDRRRGVEGTFRRLVEEIGELARALRHGSHDALEEEVGDVLAWTVTVASLVGVDAGRAAARYGAGCPKCGALPCRCVPDPERSA